MRGRDVENALLGRTEMELGAGDLDKHVRNR